MRLWSLHPKYLDSRGLVALWREGLLAQSVLAGGTSGYRHHPQLERFRGEADPVAAVAAYLRAIVEEAERRGYRFDASKLRPAPEPVLLPVTAGQLGYEWEHLRRKLERRDPERAKAHGAVEEPDPHPLFRVVPGPIAPWERPA